MGKNSKKSRSSKKEIKAEKKKRNMEKMISFLNKFQASMINAFDAKMKQALQPLQDKVAALEVHC